MDASALPAQTSEVEASVAALPVRQYLESSVVATLMQGLQAVSKERPDNPIQFLAFYLLAHNPQGAEQAPVSGGANSTTPAGTTA
ncbi:MAG: hypothetical protein WDW38_007312 [Sanguina aurantia]